jgi:hypothetical protein
MLFMAVAGGVVANGFVVYPTQSLIGSAILAAGAIAFLLLPKQKGAVPLSTAHPR